MLPTVMMHPRHEFRMTKRQDRPWRRWLVVVLLLAWWASQGAALVHAVDHPKVDFSHHGTVRMASYVASVDDNEPHAHTHNWGHDAGTPNCDLLDDLLGVAAVAQAPLVIAKPPAAASIWGAAKPPLWPSLALPAYQARGPPTV